MHLKNLFVSSRTLYKTGMVSRPVNTHTDERTNVDVKPLGINHRPVTGNDASLFQLSNALTRGRKSKANLFRNLVPLHPTTLLEQSKNVNVRLVYAIYHDMLGS